MEFRSEDIKEYIPTSSQLLVNQGISPFEYTLSYQVAKLSEEMPMFLSCLFIVLKDLS
jgi:hypothetical protein